MDTITREELLALVGPRGEYYGVNNPDGDTLTMGFHRGILRRHLEHHIDPTRDDVNAHCTKYAVIYNTTPHVQRGWLYTIETLQRLPRLTELALTLGHLDYKRLRVIETVTCCVPEHNKQAWQKLDEFLVAALTATRPNQAVPSTARIRKITQEFIKKLQLSGEVDQELTPDPSINILPSYIPGYANFNLEAPTESVQAVAQAIDVLAKKHNISHAEAFTLPFLQEGGLELPKTWTVHFFGTGPEPKNFQPDYIENVGTLTEEQRELFGKDYKYFDLERIALMLVNTYTPPQELKEAVMLRDGHCRYPDCNVPATDCQVDHVIRWQDGGLTTYSNLQCLCPHHHNSKTDNRSICNMTSDGTVTWVIAGETIVTAPEGRIAGIIGSPLGNLTLRAGFTFPIPIRKPKRNGLGDWGSTLNSLLEKRRAPKPPPKPRTPPDEDEIPF